MRNIRAVTATALFDGHDVSVNLFRRLLQERGVEVIHLGHNRSVDEVAKTAIEEDADAVLVSSYQGGHNEYFRYLVDLLKDNHRQHILVFGGGGGVILPAEIEALEACGVTRLYHANDGKAMGINGIADDIIERVERNIAELDPQRVLKDLDISKLTTSDRAAIAGLISVLENAPENDAGVRQILDELKKNDHPRPAVLGVTGTGGSGKSSIIDELVNR
ncbi:hypothetical protein LCGC14_2821950, partial [marine sediment metagenome]